MAGAELRSASLLAPCVTEELWSSFQAMERSDLVIVVLSQGLGLAASPQCLSQLLKQGKVLIRQL